MDMKVHREVIQPKRADFGFILNPVNPVNVLLGEFLLKGQTKFEYLTHVHRDNKYIKIESADLCWTQFLGSPFLIRSTNCHVRLCCFVCLS